MKNIKIALGLYDKKYNFKSLIKKIFKMWERRTDINYRKEEGKNKTITKVIN